MQENPSPSQPAAFAPDEACAVALDAADPLAGYRQRFHIPRRPDGSEVIYLAGNSLGLQPKGVQEIVNEELAAWAGRAVDGHFDGTRPWYSYHELCRETGAHLVGAEPGEVVVMNSLTVNLHLMMVSFYRPTGDRYKILIEEPCFPSDTYAIKSQLRYHGYDPQETLVVLRPRPGEHLIRHEDIEATLQREGPRIALVLLGAVNFVTGQAFDIPRITAAAHEQGCIVGFDLAHAAGNIPLKLHDWGVDFAIWCNYKYLNSGPGAVGACFVHQRHAGNLERPRFAGWWGNDPNTRFRMQLQPEFVPRGDADGWQISNPPILALAPVKVSYDVFDEAGVESLRCKSELLTAYLWYLLGEMRGARKDSRTSVKSRAGDSVGAGGAFEVITPADPAQRGCQLSLLFRENARAVLQALHAEGVTCDFREPNVIRVAPVPLYNTFHDVWRFASILARCGGAAVSS